VKILRFIYFSVGLGLRSGFGIFGRVSTRKLAKEAEFLKSQGCMLTNEAPRESSSRCFILKPSDHPDLAKATRLKLEAFDSDGQLWEGPPFLKGSSGAKGVRSRFSEKGFAETAVTCRRIYDPAAKVASHLRLAV
jgi:hypothetical protein